MLSISNSDSQFPSASFSRNPAIVFHVVTDQLKKQAFDCECLAFGTSYIYNRILDVDSDTHFQIYKSILEQPEMDHISTCAIDTRNQKVISGMRNEPYPPGGVHVYPTLPDGSLHSYNAILRVLDDRWSELFAKLNLKPNENEFMYFFMGYTDPAYFKQGIFSELYPFTEKVAKDRGFRYIFGLFMSKPMQAVMTKKYGYQNLLELKYDEVEVGGKFPMKQFIDEHSECRSESIMFGFKAI